MAERYIDANRLCEWLKNLKSGFTKEELVFRDELIDHLKGDNGIANVLPPADVVEVTRCKNCKHYRHYGKTSLLIDGKNVKAGWCQRRTRYDEECRMLPDDFCSYGERKDK